MNTKHLGLMALLAAAGCRTSSTADVETRPPDNPVIVREDDRDVGIDIVPLVRRAAAPRPSPTPAPPPFIPDYDDYRLIAALTRLIEEQPGNPVAYELRARLWDRLGWEIFAARDRFFARMLRRTTTPPS